MWDSSMSIHQTTILTLYSEQKAHLLLTCLHIDE
jgi:hypothetical protein